MTHPLTMTAARTAAPAPRKARPLAGAALAARKARRLRAARTILAVATLWVASAAGAAMILASLGWLAERNAAAPVLALTAPGLSPLPSIERGARPLAPLPRQGVNLFEFTKVAMAREAVLR